MRKCENVFCFEKLDYKSLDHEILEDISILGRKLNLFIVMRFTMRYSFGISFLLCCSNFPVTLIYTRTETDELGNELLCQFKTCFITW